MSSSTLTGTESFCLRVQRAEAVRTLLMIGVFGCLMAVVISRRLAGGEVMRVDTLFWPSVAILGFAMLCEAIAHRAVARANRDGWLISDRVWQILTAIELAAPLGALALQVFHSPIHAPAALGGPIVLVLPIVVMLSLLHLRPIALKRL